MDHRQPGIPENNLCPDCLNYPIRESLKNLSEVVSSR